ncbi:MAG: sigma-70 family RNA polymerase sigma factor [Bacilli bacterium]|nr:sigma-70 family RNA polymerase sigma factor [Bacilli bacterium]
MEKEIERLIQDYGNDVLRIAYMYLKDRHLAEDAFQEVFIRVYHKWDTFREESSEKTWIIKIAINVCKDMLKSYWHRNVSFYELEDIYKLSNNTNDVELAMERKSLLENVLRLPDKYKDVILLYYYQGFSVQEIANILDTTVGNVTSLLSRARKLLKESLEVIE